MLIRNSLLREINTKPVVVVMGMTGSGKTTQVPQFILENYIGGCGLSHKYTFNPLVTILN